MPRLLAKLPPTSHAPAAKVLLGLAVIFGLAALLCFLDFSQATETSGHLWWRETRSVPLTERRPYAWWGTGLIGAGLFCLAGSLELVVAAARRTESQMPFGTQPRTSLPMLLATAAGRAWQHLREAPARRHYEQSIAGRAEITYARGDEFFSITLELDDELAQHLNDIYAAGWRQHTRGRSHRSPNRVARVQMVTFRRAARD